ncbi:MAG: hypothetical protein K2X27_03570 [Candidatus Obscuribacterales bacterium]|nr:hypothetical protein [Candidatus Obscuribacterales bacterium]
MVKHCLLGTILISAFVSLASSKALAQSDIDPTAQWTSPVVKKESTPNQPLTGKAAIQTQVVAPDGMTPEPGLYSKPCTCQAQYPPNKSPEQTKKSKHPILKGLKNELAMEMGDLGKDTFMAFSVCGKDPYEMPDHPNIPYIAAEAQFVDGSSSHMYKYPDGSWRVDGGFLNGTYACPQPDGLLIVQYPNGARGTMKLTDNGGEIIRPDNTITTFTKAGQAMRVVNSKLGYMGDINKDTTGLSYEFAKQDF